MIIQNPNNYHLPEKLETLFSVIYDRFKKRFELCDYELELSVVDENTIKDLNSLYRNSPYETDVLSFAFNPQPPEKLLGAIYFCYSVIKQNNEDLLYEFCFLFVHSLLHLIGYNHGDIMFSLQDEIIKELFSCYQ